MRDRSYAFIALFVVAVGLSWSIFQHNNGPAYNPSLSIAGCGAPTNDYVPLWDSTNFCLNWQPVSSVSSATLTVDLNGVQQISNVTTLGFNQGFTITTSSQDAEVYVALTTATLTDDTVLVGAASGLGAERTLCTSGALYYGGTLFTCSNDITGNAATATALAANPSDCSANQYATTIAANGDLTCSGITLGTNTSGNYVATLSTATGLTDDCAAGEGSACTVYINFATVPTDGQCLAWNASLAQPYGSACSGGSITGGSCTSGPPQQFTISINTSGVPTCDTVLANSDLADFAITAVASGNILLWDGTGWANATITGDASVNSSGVVTVSNAGTADAPTTAIGSCTNQFIRGFSAAFVRSCASVATTDIASPTGVDTNIVTGTKGSTDDCAKWNADGDLVSAGASCATVTGGTCTNSVVVAISSSAVPTCAKVNLANWVSGTLSIASTTLDAGRSLTLTGDTLSADAELYTRSCNWSVVAATVTADVSCSPANAVAVTVTRMFCITSTGTASYTMDEKTRAQIFGTGTTVDGTQGCDTSGRTVSSGFSNADISAGSSLVAGWGTISGDYPQLTIIIDFTVND
jgi:hypothetical protein